MKQFPGKKETGGEEEKIKEKEKVCRCLSVVTFHHIIIIKRRIIITMITNPLDSFCYCLAYSLRYNPPPPPQSRICPVFLAGIHSYLYMKDTYVPSIVCIWHPRSRLYSSQHAYLLLLFFLFLYLLNMEQLIYTYVKVRFPASERNASLVFQVYNYFALYRLAGTTITDRSKTFQGHGTKRRE